jgi:hypothetical protein
MKLIVLLGVALVWGQLSTQFFFRSWISFLGVICCIIGLFKARTPVRHILNILFTKISETVFFGLLLFTGFYTFYFRLEFGQSELEVLMYFISTTVRLLYVLPKISEEIDAIWRSVNEPDSDK